MAKKKLDKVHVISYRQKIRGVEKTQFVALISSYAAKTEYNVMCAQCDSGLNNMVSVSKPIAIIVKQ